MQPVKSKILPPINKSEEARRATHPKPGSEHILKLAINMHHAPRLSPSRRKHEVSRATPLNRDSQEKLEREDAPSSTTYLSLPKLPHQQEPTP